MRSRNLRDTCVAPLLSALPIPLEPKWGHIMLPYARTANRLRTPEKEFRGRGLGVSQKFETAQSQWTKTNENKRGHHQDGKENKYNGKATKNTKCTTIWHLFQQFRRAKRSKKLRMKGCRVAWLVLQTKAARNFNFNLGSHWRLLLLEKSKRNSPEFVWQMSRVNEIPFPVLFGNGVVLIIISEREFKRFIRQSIATEDKEPRGTEYLQIRGWKRYQKGNEFKHI